MSWKQVSTLLLAFSSIAWAEARATDLTPAIYVRAPTTTTVRPGQGWNTALGAPTANTCISGYVMDREAHPQSTISFQQVRSRSELMSASSVSAGASGMFGEGSASATASWAEATTIDDQAVNIAAQLLVTSEIDTVVTPLVETQLQQLRKSPAPSDVLNPDNSSSSAHGLINAGSNLLTIDGAHIHKTDLDFREMCGDKFVLSVTRGGAATFLYSFTVHSESEAKQVAASVSGSYAALNVNASVNSAISSYSNSSSLNIRSDIVGGSPEISISPTSAQSDIAAFIQSVPTSAVGQYVYLVSYEDIEHGNIRVDDEDATILDKIVESYYDVSDLELATQTTLEPSAPYLLDNPSFSNVTTTQLAIVKDDLDDEKVRLLNAANLCVNPKVRTCALPQLSFDDYQLRSFLPMPTSLSAGYRSLTDAEADLNTWETNGAQLTAVAISR
ncbi:MAG: hypothetical protein ACHP7N_12780 [Caulobacterales bacterium]